MENQEKNNREYYTIDVLHIVKSLWRRAWLIALCGLLAAAIGFSVSAFGIAPTYSSSIKLYVNNSSISLGNTNFSISASELTAAQSLVRTYGDILDSWNTLERVIEKAEVDYTWQELSAMIAYAPSNETEIMLVTVTCEDPYEATKIANAIAEVLPIRIS
jgi:capsular polysaccharide biosynthesis protein